MPEQKKINNHHRAWLLSGGVFLLLVLAAAGPLVYKAMADLTAAEQQVLQLKNAAITEAIANNDYETWSSLIDDEQLKSQVNASNFIDFASAYLLLEKGKIEEANLIKKSIGIRGRIAETSSISALITDSIARRDYDSWRSLVGSDYAAGMVTPTNFDSYAKALDAAGKGKLNMATRLQYSLGLKYKLDYSSSHR